ncbi:MAG: CorA family divalent cation transporter, partial [Chthoniobacterales bacterium]
DSRASIVSNNLNHLIKKFTIVSIAIMMANLVVGAFGMNVKVPWQDVESWWPFFVTSLVAVGSAVGVLWLWRVRKW